MKNDRRFEASQMRATLFDAEWYESQGPSFEGDAWSHFAADGWRTFRDPHPLFCVDFYLSQRPIMESDEDPVTHYIRVGAAAGISPHWLFDPSFYCTRYAALLENDNPLVHFLTVGREKQLDPNEFFDVSWYLERYEDVRNSDIDPVVHYAVFGRHEWERQPHRLFDALGYALRHSLEPGTHPFEHFLNRYHRLRGCHHGREAPECSVIILNFNKAILTLQCVVELLESKGAERFEVIVVDNGSRQEDFHVLTSGLPFGVRVIRLQINRFFGEGNNIGVDSSRAQYIMFLNNDAFVRPTTFLELRAVLVRYGDAGAVGPKFLYPDGRIQEAGGRLSECGLVTQRGKYLENERGRFEQIEPMDYISAACLFVPRSVLDEVAGFDLAFEPAYYEDVDLCFKIALLGLKIYYCGTAVVTHIENATSGDTSLNLGLSNIVEINREKFIARWSEYIRLGGQSHSMHVHLPSPLRESPRTKEPVAVLYTPYELVPGGGERYILSIAEALSSRYRTVVITPERYSNYRLRTISTELNLDLSAVRLESASELPAYGDCDLFVGIGNEVLPPVRGIGRRRIFVCQFPFPMHVTHSAAAWDSLETYDMVVVYSDYVARHFKERAANLCKLPRNVVVLPPPVPQFFGSARERRRPRILHVGRFAPAGHAKRQDALLEAFRALVRAHQADDLELHFVGTIPADPSCRKYFTEVRDAARGLPVHFHINASSQTISELYATSSLYWHATGFGQNEHYNPQFFEHFGISVVEAMSAGAIPFVYDGGGPAEIVLHGSNGLEWHSIAELVELSRSVLMWDIAKQNVMRASAIQTAKQYDISIFRHRLAALIRDLRPRSAFGTDDRAVEDDLLQVSQT